ncbi:MAG: hypothetical protein NWF05_05405 [Candidatus Bathyarchaeota archaeon]|nr:hypothetical protein [Candidatus Bathyarchaeota archaeon]
MEVVVMVMLQGVRGAEAGLQMLYLTTVVLIVSITGTVPYHVEVAHTAIIFSLPQWVAIMPASLLVALAIPIVLPPILMGERTFIMLVRVTGSIVAVEAA